MCERVQAYARTHSALADARAQKSILAIIIIYNGVR